MSSGIRLTGATLVLPDRLIPSGQIVIESGRIAEVSHAAAPGGRDLQDHFIVPGFIDVHVHGVLGHDALDNGASISRIAELMPGFGVTAFCPTSIACSPAALAGMLRGVRAAREAAVA